jgi:hypothetical protein
VEAAIATRSCWWICGGRHCWGGLTLKLDVEVREGWLGGKMEEAGKELPAGTMLRG